MTAGMPGVATQQASARQIGAFYGAMFLQRRKGVLGTAGIKAAVGAQ